MIHCALLGSIERFSAVYIEHTAGKFPLWLAPEQLRILTLKNDKNILRMAKNVVNSANALGIRVSLDDSNESLGKKIRDTEVLKIPYTVVIGMKEAESGEVEARNREDLPKIKPMNFDRLLEELAQNAKDRT